MKIIRTERISCDTSFIIQRESANAVKVTLTQDGREYTKVVSSDAAAEKWIEKQVRTRNMK